MINLSYRGSFLQRLLILGLLAGLPGINAVAQERYLDAAERARLQTLIDSPDRSEDLRARNHYRNPLETLDFFEVHADLTVVEIWPGGQGGWYRSILEPYLASGGTYIPIASNSDFPAPLPDLPDGTADRVLVFRAHGFMIYEHAAQDYFDALYRLTKPGGEFGIVDHRGDEAIPQDPEGENGYVNQSHVRRLAENAGFELIEQSEINANPADTKDYPDGVYSLPPTLRGSLFNRGFRERMREIGESDRMTLKFRRPD